MNKNNLCTVIVSSYDGNADVWPPFFVLFKRYWPDCPFEIILIANKKTYADSSIKTIQIDPDQKWASNIKKALEEIQSPFILYFQDDYFLYKKIDTQKILDILAWAQKNTVGYIRLFGMPDPDLAYESPFPGLGELSKQAQYRVSLQTAFWNKNTLMNILREGESGWDMEMKGTERSYIMPDIFLGFEKQKSPVLYIEVIKKGEWVHDIEAISKQLSILLELRARPIRKSGNRIMGYFRSTTLFFFLRKIYKSLQHDK